VGGGLRVGQAWGDEGSACDGSWRKVRFGA
jgi:hypothetical protein